MLSGERMPAQQQTAVPPPPPAHDPSEQQQQQQQQAEQPQAGSCGLGALLTAGCRGRAEAFARRLHRRLQTLGMGVGGGSAGAEDERPLWPPPPPPPAPTSLARVPSDGDVFYDPVDSPSPVETTQPTAAALMQTCSSDSDSSEVLFFDPESSTTSNCSSGSGSGGDDEPFAAYNGCAASSSSSSSDTGTLSGISSSSSSALQVRVLGNASDDSRSTRTPSEDTRSPSRSASGSDDSRPLSELSALEPTPSSYSTLEDSVCTVELSVEDDGVSTAATAGRDDETLSEALSRLHISNGDGDESNSINHEERGDLVNGDDHEDLGNLHSKTCREGRWRLHNGDDHEEPGSPHYEADRNEEASVTQEEKQENGQTSGGSERAFVAVDLQLSCEIDMNTDTAEALEGTKADVSQDRGICDSQSAENLRVLCEMVAEDSEDQRAEVTNGHVEEDDQTVQSGCRIVISPEPDCEPTAASVSNDEEDDSRPQRVRRSSSLKTGKTPPGTPGRKKIVRFADVLGLDLADVRTFLDEIPKIPSSAYDDLRDVDPSLGSSPPKFTSPLTSLMGTQQSMGFAPTTTLVPLFPQPWTQPDFLDRVRDRQVCLESATLQDPALLSLSGIVRVRNLDFHKSVFVRYSTDGWRTWADVPARYVDGSCDGFSDRFQFVLYAHALPAGGRLELAVRFQCRGAQHWDNNAGANYVFQCVATAAAPALEPLSPVDDRWPSFY